MTGTKYRKVSTTLRGRKSSRTAAENRIADATYPQRTSTAARKPPTVVVAACRNARAIGVTRPVATASSTVISSEYACATLSGGPSSRSTRSTSGALVGRRANLIETLADVRLDLARRVRDHFARQKRPQRSLQHEQIPTDAGLADLADLHGRSPPAASISRAILAMNVLPVRGHQRQPLASGVRQAVVLAGVRPLRRVPLRRQHPFRRQAAQYRIHGPFGDHQVGELFQVPDDFEAISGALARRPRRIARSSPPRRSCSCHPSSVTIRPSHQGVLFYVPPYTLRHKVTTGGQGRSSCVPAVMWAIRRLGSDPVPYRGLTPVSRGLTRTVWRAIRAACGRPRRDDGRRRRRAPRAAMPRDP